ncbi:MAG: DUF4363 family protein [Bacteroides sp.]|nr:DUF4363 family protein [Roseburia sp.]MCM1463096.1 DUF4363 family protein [Bacteroides sp.]
MKRIIICGIIMLALVVLGAASLYYTDTSAKEAEGTLEEIDLRFREGDLDGARGLARELSADWERYIENHFFMTDKEHVMELSSMIARIRALADEGDEELTVECAVARELMTSYRLKNAVGWNNIF